MSSTQATAVGYVRVSTEEQVNSGLSLQAQDFSIAEGCRVRDLLLASTLRDEGMSAATLEGRSGAGAAFEALANGADALVVTRLDRLVRNAIEGLVLVRDWFSPPRPGQPPRKRLISLAEHIDTATPAGRFALGLHLLQGQYEREVTALRTVEALAQLKRNGRELGRVPYGWRRKDGVMTEHAGEQDVMAAMLARRAGGMPDRYIAQALNVDGIPAHRGGKWTAVSVARVLERRGSAPSTPSPADPPALP